MQIGIYMIKNEVDNKVYVGQTDDYKRRLRQHKNALRKGKHDVTSLQEDFTRLGEHNFTFYFIKEYLIEELDEMEEYWIEKLNAFEDFGGYNRTTGGNKGTKFSLSSKRKLSEGKRRLFEDPQYRQKIQKLRKKWANSKEGKAHFRKQNKETMSNPEIRKRISDKMKEHWNNDELKKKKSEEVKERYKDQSERKKTAEATKKGMAKLPKEKLSRERLCPYPKEMLIEMTKNTHLTQKQLAEKFEVPLSMAKSIKAKSHWIYKYM